MNLSRLENMVRRGDLSSEAARYLIDCRGECEWLDYKRELALDDDRGVANFTRDVVAMKNTGGGYLVIGVEDKTWRPVGLDSQLDYDTKILRDKVRKGSGVEIDIDIVHHKLRYSEEARFFGIILIRASRKRHKRRVPTLIKSDFAVRERYALRRGEIYVRRGDSTIKIDSSEQLESILDDLEGRADADSILEMVPTSPFAVDSGTFRLQPKDFGIFVGRSNLRENVVNALTGDPRVWIVNIHGPGGVGKSALATWAAYELLDRGSFEAILQLTAKETVLEDDGIRRYHGRTLYSLEDLLSQICSLFEQEAPADLSERVVLAEEILSSWKTLLILDNMETIDDRRILGFVQSLPPETKCRVLLTSRHRSPGWEFAIPVQELDDDEVREFVGQKMIEMGLQIALDRNLCQGLKKASGGLPLAIQWILGRYKRTRDLQAALSAVDDKNSPVLEFSFRNVWNILSSDARTILALASIFDDPPGLRLLAIASSWDIDRLEAALSQLVEVTLMARVAGSGDAGERFVALPITLQFARKELAGMGELEVVARREVQKYNEQMELRSWEVERFSTVFTRYGIVSENDRRAAILCRRGESESFAGRDDVAADLFGQARDLAPNSAYVYAMSANSELSARRVGNAKAFSDAACKYASKSTGALAWSVAARVADAEGARDRQVRALRKAVDYDPRDLVLRHQLGVALSRIRDEIGAIEQFSFIVDAEIAAEVPSETLLMALKTRVINLRRLDRMEEASEDIALAFDILSRHPNLQRQRTHIEALLE